MLSIKISLVWQELARNASRPEMTLFWPRVLHADATDNDQEAGHRMPRNGPTDDRMTILPKAALSAALFSCALLAGFGGGHGSAAAETRAGLSGSASYYGKQFHGRKTANGERFNMNAMTAAHRSLPFGTKVRVTNRNNGRSVIVRINDRGPYAHGRVIDLSQAAAKSIGMISSGVARVEISRL